MKNYYLLLLLCGLVAVISNRNTQAPKLLSPDPTRITRPEIKPPQQVVALVKYDEVIYRCYSVKLLACGYTLQCEDFSVQCADKIVVEYVKKEN